MNTDFNRIIDIELENEQWRDIEGYDGMYQVSNLGRVRSRKSGEWKVMRAKIKCNGYSQLDLYKDNKVKTVYIHRLVASVFIPNDDEAKNQVNHRNEIKTDNRAVNLEWCTASYNLSYNGLRRRRKQPKPYIHPRPKIDKVKRLYRADLSIDDNIKLFKSNGIECSRNTVLNLRKDLGLTNNKRDKLKELYNPDLSIPKNLELFKANGIDCSRETVIRLRKDLGLSKPRKTKQIS